MNLGTQMIFLSTIFLKKLVNRKLIIQPVQKLVHWLILYFFIKRSYVIILLLKKFAFRGTKYYGT